MELEKFREFWTMEHPEITRKSWEATWRKWIRRTETYKTKHKPPPDPDKQPPKIFKDDPRFPALRARHRLVHNKDVPQGKDHWFFPREWVTEEG
jgi:hypothetical protein